MNQVLWVAEAVMPDEGDQRLVGEWTFALPLAADEALHAIEARHAVHPGQAGSFSRHANQVRNDAPMIWKVDIDGEEVAGTAPGSMTIVATDKEQGGCMATVFINVDLSDVPMEAREEVTGGFAQAGKYMIPELEAYLRGCADAHASVESGTFDFTCTLNVDVEGTVEEVMEAITDMQAMSLRPQGYIRSGDAVSVGLPFEWDFAKGGSTIRGVSPATLTLIARDEGGHRRLNIKYIVNLSNAPE